MIYAYIFDEYLDLFVYLQSYLYPVFRVNQPRGAKSHAKWLMPTVDVDESLGFSHTVDGSEIWRSPVEAGNLTHYLQGGHPLAASVCLWLLVFCCSWLLPALFCNALKRGQ